MQFPMEAEQEMYGRARKKKTKDLLFTYLLTYLLKSLTAVGHNH